MKRDIEKAKEVVEQAGHILCPTDTIWGISADATSETAVERVFLLKKRAKNKSMIVLVNGIEMLEKHVESIPKLVVNLLQSSSKPVSIIYPAGKNLANNVLAKNGSVAIRMVSKGFCHELINLLDKPIISTSANFSGDPSPRNYHEINNELKLALDYCVPYRDLYATNEQPSSIYLMDGKELKQIR